MDHFLLNPNNVKVRCDFPAATTPHHPPRSHARLLKVLWVASQKEPLCLSLLSLCRGSGGSCWVPGPHDLPHAVLFCKTCTQAHSLFHLANAHLQTEPWQDTTGCCYFAMTTGSLSCLPWLPYWCSHTCRRIIPFSPAQNNILGCL